MADPASQHDQTIQQEQIGVTRPNAEVSPNKEEERYVSYLTLTVRKVNNSI